MIRGVIRTHTILDRYIERTAELLHSSKHQRLPSSFRTRFTRCASRQPSFHDALKEKKDRRTLALISEIKRASPSEGLFHEGNDIRRRAVRYATGGATAISVLTQPLHFRGSLRDLSCVRRVVHVPIIRKDFIFDPYHLYESKLMGASAVLLIAMVLETSLLRELLLVARDVGLDVLVEVHDAPDVEKALAAGAPLLGVNSRDLRTMTVHFDTFYRILPLIPKDVIRVAESGISTKEHVRMVRGVGADAILVGTSLMKSENPDEKMHELLSVFSLP